MHFSSERTDFETAHAIYYTQNNTVRRLLNYCFHWKSTKRSPCIDDLHVVVNNVQRFSVDTASQQWVVFALLPIYKIFRTVVNKITYLVLHVMCPTLLSDFKEIRKIPTDFLESLLSNLQEIRPVGASLIKADSRMDKQTNGCDENNIKGTRHQNLLILYTFDFVFEVPHPKDMLSRKCIVIQFKGFISFNPPHTVILLKFPC